MVNPTPNRLFFSTGSALLAVGLLLLLIISLTPPTAGGQIERPVICPETEVEDIDGNIYPTIEIGGQCWLTENLKVTRYRDGQSIAKLDNYRDWWTDKNGAFNLYDHLQPFRYPTKTVESETEMLEVFGYLYNFHAVSHPAGLCPTGWKVPSDQDWQELEIALGLSPQEADERWHRGSNQGSLLAGDNSWWPEGRLTADSEFGRSGFRALPAGYRRAYGDYGNLGTNANFWTSNEANDKNAFSREIYSGTEYIYRIVNIDKNNGHSVRCLLE